jgi:hypothetical protein
MRRSRHSSNAFSQAFLKRFEERDEPPTGPEADVAGPWFVEPAHSRARLRPVPGG